MVMQFDLPTRTVLDSAPARVLNFVVGLNASTDARAQMMSVGYTQQENELVWSLLGRLATLPAPTGALDKKVMAALTELKDWDEPNFAIIAAILLRKFPDQAEFVFRDLAPSAIPAQAAFAISTLLDRLDALEKSPERKATRKVDQQALERLGERGYTKEERKRLRALIQTAQTVVEPDPITREESDSIKLELYRFLAEWTTQAKAVIKRRDILIRMGIGKRKRRGAAAAPVTPTPSTLPTGTLPTPPSGTPVPAPTNGGSSATTSPVAPALPAPMPVPAPVASPAPNGPAPSASATPAAAPPPAAPQPIAPAAPAT